jgi:integrase
MSDAVTEPCLIDAVSRKAVYLEGAIAALRRHRQIDDALLAYVAPLGWNRITHRRLPVAGQQTGRPTPIPTPPPPASLTATGLAYKNFRFLRSPLLDAVELHARDHALIRLLYNGGLRVSEAVSLQWRNLVDGIVNIRGKGGRTRVVRLSRGTWAELQALRPADALGDDRVFPMTAWNAWDRVRRAARTAGLEALVSPHFLRCQRRVKTDPVSPG